MPNPFATLRLALTALAVLLYAACLDGCSHDSNVLWRLVHERCVPGQQQRGDPAPCVAVDLAAGEAGGYAVLKDIKGAHQFLLIPTRRVTGIESAELVAPVAPDYFAAAWRARGDVEAVLGHSLGRDQIALAVNSEYGRSQNQLHIHVDCLRADVRAALRAQLAGIGGQWQALPQPLAGHAYRAMRVASEDLQGVNPFALLAAAVPAGEMGRHTLVAVGETFADGSAGFVLLDDQASLWRLDAASGADLLDHGCV